MSDSDALLWQRAVAGDSDAFGYLYGRHSKAIYNYLERVRSEVSVAPRETGLARYEAQEQMRALLLRLRALPRKQQDVVALCLWSGLSYDEAARALSVPVGTVRSRLSRARTALAELEPLQLDFSSDAQPEVIP